MQIEKYTWIKISKAIALALEDQIFIKSIRIRKRYWSSLLHLIKHQSFK